MDKYAELFIKNIQHYAPNWSNSDLSRACDVSQSAISRIFSGHQDPSLETIVKIAKGLKVEPSQLLVDRREKNIPADILNLLENQSETVYETIRTMLHALNPQSKKKIK